MFREVLLEETLREADVKTEAEGCLKMLCCWNEGGERSHKARNADASRGYEGQILL